MSVLVVIVAALAVASSANGRSVDWIDNQENHFDQKNVVTVRPNCPPGQEYINGECRDVWNLMWRQAEAAPSKIITVPTVCPSSQVLINGVCRDVWSLSSSELHNLFLADADPSNVAVVPPNCPPGQQLINGACRDVWLMKFQAQHADNFQPSSSNDVNKLGLVDAAPTNAAVVPPNCRPGQQLINGECRDIWLRRFQSQQAANLQTSSSNDLNNLETSKNFGNFMNSFLRALKETDTEDRAQNVNDINNPSRNIISVPNHCPAGYRPDTLGVCRPTFD